MITFDLKPSQKKLRAMKKLCALYRGEYINEVAILEYLMEEVIVYYFTGCNKQKSLELIHAYFGTASCSFKAKRDLVIFIVEKYDEFKTHYVKMDEYLQKISSFRNIIAHQKMVLTPKVWNAFDKDNVFLVDTTTKDRRIIEKQKKINKKLMKEEIYRVELVSKKCADLYNLIVTKKT
jgi:hypothetical protein